MSETVEVSRDALEALYGHVDVSAIRKHNEDALKEASIVLEAQDCDAVSVTHE